MLRAGLGLGLEDLSPIVLQGDGRIGVELPDSQGGQSRLGEGEPEVVGGVAVAVEGAGGVLGLGGGCDVAQVSGPVPGCVVVGGLLLVLLGIALRVVLLRFGSGRRVWLVGTL